MNPLHHHVVGEQLTADTVNALIERSNRPMSFRDGIDDTLGVSTVEKRRSVTKWSHGWATEDIAPYSVFTMTKVRRSAYYTGPAMDVYADVYEGNISRYGALASGVANPFPGAMPAAIFTNDDLQIKANTWGLVRPVPVGDVLLLRADDTIIDGFPCGLMMDKMKLGGERLGFVAMQSSHYLHSGDQVVRACRVPEPASVYGEVTSQAPAWAANVLGKGQIKVKYRRDETDNEFDALNPTDDGFGGNFVLNFWNATSVVVPIGMRVLCHNALGVGLILP